MEKADADAIKATEVGYFWVQQAHAVLHGVAAFFDPALMRTESDLLERVSDSDLWQLDVTLESVAFAERVPRSKRAAFEAQHGSAIFTVASSEAIAPDAFEHYVVTMSTDRMAE